MQAPAKSSTKLQSAVDQGAFDFLMPFGPSRPLLRPDEVARCLGWSVRKVYELIQDGKLEAHALPERDKQRYQVTRRSVLLFLAETALSPSNATKRSSPRSSAPSTPTATWPTSAAQAATFCTPSRST